MTTVYTKNELKKAIKRKDFPIECKGEIAKQLNNLKKRSKAAKICGSLIGVGIIGLPFTAGISGIGIATGLTIGGVIIAISAIELAILVGGILALIAILKGRKVIFKSDGSVTIE